DHLSGDRTDYVPKRPAEQPRERFVAVQDAACCVHGRGTLVHRLDEHAVGRVGAFARVDLLAAGRAHHEGVQCSAARGGEDCFSLLQPLMQAPVLAQPVKRLVHRFCETMSNAASTFAVSERSPTRRRTGSGAALTSVGAARMWCSSASSGSW